MNSAAAHSKALLLRVRGARFGARRSRPLVRRAITEVRMYRIHRSLAIAGAVAALAVPLAVSAQSPARAAPSTGVTVEIVGQASEHACDRCYPRRPVGLHGRFAVGRQ